MTLAPALLRGLLGYPRGGADCFPSGAFLACPYGEVVRDCVGLDAQGVGGFEAFECRQVDVGDCRRVFVDHAVPEVGFSHTSILVDEGVWCQWT